mmetsp:Transcript_134165/g.388387  ORF Transcript_134165/g.388387 Transcript_134165/m.388387 type:complete len:370 (+) Transcript_134165:70-1179(+)
MILKPARQSKQVLVFLFAASLSKSSSHTAPFFFAATFNGVRPSMDEARGSAPLESNRLTIASVAGLPMRPSANSSTTQRSAVTPSCMFARAFAPASMSKLTAASCPAPLAVISAVSPSLSALLGSARPAISNSRIFTWPRCAALQRGLRLFPATSWSGLAPFESKKPVAVGLPALHAIDKAVNPRMLEALTSERASSRTRRHLIVPGDSSRIRFFPPAANKNGVMPSESLKLMSASAFSNTSKASGCPAHAAYISALRSKESHWSTRAPFARSSATCAASPASAASITGVARSWGASLAGASVHPEAKASSYSSRRTGSDKTSKALWMAWKRSTAPSERSLSGWCATTSFRYAFLMSLSLASASSLSTS